MPSSKYPNKLDTSIEIPAVRDNIVEVGSDVLNSLRSAIFQIERTLGLNPQGAVGNTVSDRLNKVLDGNGNILKDALDRSNVLSGPIVNKDVSKTAAINEKKLRLDFPTQLLQDEISQLINQVNSVIATLEEITALLTAHIHIDATNRHKGKAITIEAIDNTASAIGATSVEATTSQGAFEKIFRSHINYDGSDISVGNRSHEADQLFFDKTDVSAYVESDDVQGAIEDLAEEISLQLINHQNYQHDNGILRSSKIVSASDSNHGILILDSQNINYFETETSDTQQTSTVFFTTPPATPKVPINKSDILEVTDSTGATEYQIEKVTYSADGLTVDEVEVFGRFLADSEGSAKAKIYRNINIEGNIAGLLVTTREYGYLSNADVLQVANPDAATIITKDINPSEVSLTNRRLNISVDEDTVVSLDLFDASTTRQTIDSIIKNLNTQFANEALSVSAYRVDYDENKPSELAFVHSIPSDAVNSHTLTISRGSDDAIDSLGLSSFEGVPIDAGLGTKYYIQGRDFTQLDKKLSEVSLTLLTGTSVITSAAINFKEKEVKEGDLLVIYNSNSDDGTYVILDVDEDRITVDGSQLTSNKWSGVSSSDTEFYVYKNSISLTDMQFDQISTGLSRTAITDIFMNYDRDIFYNTRLEYATISIGTGYSLVSICDFEGDISSYTETNPGSIFVENSVDGNPLLSLDGGPASELKNIKKSYVELDSGKHNIKLIIYIEDSDSIAIKITLDGNFTMSLYGSKEINKEENIFLSRVIYEAGRSRIVGAGSDFPRVFRKMRRGITSQKDVGSDVIYSNQQRPLRETRSNGVIRGLEVSPASTPIGTDDIYSVDIAGGVCYVKGKRFEIDSKEALITGVSSAVDDKFFAAVDQWGRLVFAPADSVTCSCPLDPYNHCILGSIEYDSVNVVAIDLRLFIDNLDFKVLNSITVSPQAGMGHFTSINKALKYAKRFANIFPNAGTPTVHLKSGTHKVIIDTGMDLSAWAGISSHIPLGYSQGIWVNFPVNIVGEGHSTVLDLMKTFNDLEEKDDDRTKTSSVDMESFLFVAGSGLSSSVPNGDSDVLTSGFVTLKDFRLRLSSILIIDPKIKDSGGTKKLNYGINIDNVIFDYSERGALKAFNAGIALQAIDSGLTDEIGNITISNCQFLNSHIRSKSWDAQYHRNISILNNAFRGTGDGAVDGEGKYAIYNDGAGHIIGMGASGAPSTGNIEFRGNTISDNDGSVDSHIDSSGSIVWGDRISRNLYIGGRVGLKTTTPENSFHVSDGKTYLESDATAGVADSNTGVLIIGEKTGSNLGIDGNDIMARDGASGTLNDLHLNRDGGAKVIVGNLVSSTDTIVLGTGGSAEVTGNISAEDGMRSGMPDHATTMNGLPVESGEKLKWFAITGTIDDNLGIYLDGTHDMDFGSHTIVGFNLLIQSDSASSRWFPPNHGQFGVDDHYYTAHLDYNALTFGADTIFIDNAGASISASSDYRLIIWYCN